MYNYPRAAWYAQRESYERFDQQHAKAAGLNYAVTSDLTRAAAREYLITLPEDETINMVAFGECLGVRTIKFHYPEATDVLFVTACGAFQMGDTYWYVPASYAFANVMWEGYHYDDPITVRELLAIIASFD